jgi:hypothetical protein
MRRAIKHENFKNAAASRRKGGVDERLRERAGPSDGQITMLNAGVFQIRRSLRKSSRSIAFCRYGISIYICKYF